MTKTHHGCYHTEVWASPVNWQTTTAKSALKENWYVQCNFFDPAFADKYPKGYPVRKKVNKPKTLQERKAVIAFLMQEMPAAYSQGYNPITNTFMLIESEHDAVPIYSNETPLLKALEMALDVCDYKGDYLRNLKSVIRRFTKSVIALHYDTLEIGNFLNIHLKQIFDYQQSIDPTFTDKAYNKHLSYLSPLFTVLLDNNMIPKHPVIGFKKKSVQVDTRDVLTPAQRLVMDAHLRAKHATFYIFTQVYFHSAGRVEELLLLKPEHVDIYNLKYKTFIKKGKLNKWVDRPIKKISVEYWIEALKNSKPGDYVFSRNLQPGKDKIRREQITRRWSVHVKQKLGITADFASLKHSNLTEISERASRKTAAQAAGHTSEKMVKKHYDVGGSEREMNAVRNMTNTLAPQIKLKSDAVCYPTKFVFGFTKLTA